MKWDWGKGIALSFVLFCGFVIWIVVQAFQQDFDLVSETYYQDELVYQQRIDQKVNLMKSGSRILVDQKKDEVVFTFPEKFLFAKGEIRFYHPSREIFDRQFSIEVDDAGQQKLSKESIVKGRYMLKFIWISDSTEYYQEEEIFIR